LKFGILSDLHLGHTGDGRWHNRLLFDRAEEIASAAVTALNAQKLDAVFVLGDITQAGEESQLALAKAIFNELDMPWFVLPGNHDRPAVRSGAFDREFRGRLVPEFFLHGSLAIAGLREDVPAPGEVSSRWRMDAEQATNILKQLERSFPDTLLLFSHVPFIDESEWAAKHAGKDAGCFENGKAFLTRAAGLTEGFAAAFCGHQHWHHIVTDPAWTHCTTAALIEYPMEARIVTLKGPHLEIATLTVAESLAGASLESAGWVRGRAEDRKASITLQVEDVNV